MEGRKASYPMGLRSCTLVLITFLALPAVISALAEAGPDFSKAIFEGRAALSRHGQSQRRRLQQANTYSPNSAPPGSRTGAGLLMYTPANCLYLDPDDFGTFVANAYLNNSVPGVYLSSGNYSVFSSIGKPWTVQFSCYLNGGRQAPFELDMGGSFLTFTNNNEAGFALDQCFNMYVHSFTATYSNSALPQTQGTVTSLQQGGSWTVQIDPGYPTSYLNGRSLTMYPATAATGLFVQNTTAVRGAGAFNPISGSNGAFTVNVPFQVPNVESGIKVAIAAGLSAGPFITSYLCTNVLLSSLTVHSSNYFGFSDFRSTNITYSGINVVPDPRGIGGIPSLLATNDDAFRSVSPITGPKFLNCNISSGGGDGISVQGAFYLTAAVTAANNSVVVASSGCGDPGCVTFKVQDTIQLYAPTLEPLGSATIASITPVSNPGTVSGYSQQQPFFNYDQANYFAVTFGSVPAAWSRGGPEGLLSSPAENGFNADLINNTVTNVIGRGIYYGGSDASVSGNVIQQPTSVGILLAPSVYYLQADAVRNVVARNNFINSTYGGLLVVMLTNAGLPAPWNIATNLTISTNTIINSQKPLVVTSAAAASVTGNTLQDVSCYPFVYQDLYGFVPAEAVVYTSYLSNSSFSQNTVSSTRGCPAGSDIYVQGPGVTGTSFA